MVIDLVISFLAIYVLVAILRRGKTRRIPWSWIMAYYFPVLCFVAALLWVIKN